MCSRGARGGVVWRSRELCRVVLAAAAAQGGGVVVSLSFFRSPLRRSAPALPLYARRNNRVTSKPTEGKVPPASQPPFGY